MNEDIEMELIGILQRIENDLYVAWLISSNDAEMSMFPVRIRALISEIKAEDEQPAPVAEQTWRPLEAGTYHTDGEEIFRIEGARVTLYTDEGIFTFDLPQKYTVCRTNSKSAK